MSDQKKMTVQGALIMMATMIVASCKGAGAVVIHAAVDLGDHSEFLQALLKQLDTLVSLDQRDSKVISQVSSEVAGSLLQSAPSVTIRGNITDSERRLTLTFTVHAARAGHSPAALQEDDDDDWEDDEWRGSSGVLSPLVDAVEPYFLGFVELVFNGILSTVISNFLEGSNLLGDVRLV